MNKPKEIRHVDGNDTALSEIASPRFSKIRSTEGKRASRGALGLYLKELGAEDAAALFADATRS